MRRKRIRPAIIMRAVLSTANQRDFHYKLAGTAVESASAECSHCVYFVSWQCVQFSSVWRSRLCGYEQLAAVRPLRTSVYSEVLTMLLDERIWSLFKRHWPQTLTYWSVFFSFGLCIAFLGPTILDLRCQTQSTLQQITWVFVSQQFFLLVGSSVGGLFKKTWVWLVNTECFHEV